jgi:hypothetical protein
MPLIETKGAASAQGFGEFTASAPKLYIEDVFSTYLYAGNGSTQTITNGIDLSGKGGLVWGKDRGDTVTYSLFDTARGASKTLSTANANAQGNNSSPYVPTFLSNGFETSLINNENLHNFISWTFRKQPKFFDVVTYTGTGSATTISHNLGSVPGCIIVKRTDTTGDWQVYHRSTGNTKYLVLNSTAAEATSSTRWNNTTPTSTVFSIGTEATVNASGGTYVAYLFAHDAGGFGLSGTDNVISCGSFTTGAGGGASVTLGYEPQWLIIKSSSNTSDWYLFNNMSGWVVGGVSRSLKPNTSVAEFDFGNASLPTNPTATGFKFTDGLFPANETWIYIAIRRGPMKVPTSGTSVYYGETYTGNATARSFTAPGFPPDLFVSGSRSAVADGSIWGDRLRGADRTLYSAYTQAESTLAQVITAFGQNGASIGTDSSINGNTNTYVGWNFRRAPGFFDVVCYTGTGSSPMAQPHNLSVAPELMIFKVRNSASYGWWTMVPGLISDGYGGTGYLQIQSTAAYTATGWTSPIATSSNITIPSNHPAVNASGSTYVAYLFATVAGVSKVGSYTGSGTTKQIDCGFTGGARFVLIKRTDSTGGWYVYDTARGIVSGNDSYLLLNSTAAEVTNTDYVDTYSAGFELSSTAPAGLNANGGTYIFLAIA